MQCTLSFPRTRNSSLSSMRSPSPSLNSPASKATSFARSASAISAKMHLSAARKSAKVVDKLFRTKVLCLFRSALTLRLLTNLSNNTESLSAKSEWLRMITLKRCRKIKESWFKNTRRAPSTSAKRKWWRKSTKLKIRILRPSVERMLKSYTQRWRRTPRK